MSNITTFRGAIGMLLDQFDSGLITEYELAQNLIQVASTIPEPKPGTVDSNTGLKY